ncbi:MAG: hypothetical protein M3547_13525, partial [Acidobacteriota bacterium]|nr:hypothetical protein [Acidobacteriota bacterium]
MAGVSMSLVRYMYGTVAAIVLMGVGGSAPLAAQSAGFYTLPPCRVVDTRDPAGPWGGPALSANTSRSFTMIGRCGIPTTADAVSV